MSTYILYFAITTLTINLTPGPAMMYCINSSINYGKSSGVAAAIGVELGTFVYVMITGLGLSALILNSPVLYSGLRVTGALYLIYLAYNALPRKSVVSKYTLIKGRASKLWGGIILNITNPKILLFFFTLLPQFVPVESRSIKIFFILGLSFNLSGFIVNLLAALFSHRVKYYLVKSPTTVKVISYIPSCMFSFIAIIALLSVISTAKLI